MWHHAAATYDATTGTWKLYLDGVLDQTLVLASAFQPQSASTEHAALGTSLTSTGTAAGFFAGVIDEARIWNVARTAGQIAASRDLELTSGTGLVARWGINEGAGTVVGDSIGSVTGTATNGPTWVARLRAARAAECRPQRTDPQRARQRRAPASARPRP